MNFEEKFPELGARFQEYLKYKGFKGKDIAGKTGFSASQISNIIKGKVFGTDKLFNILNIYTDLNADWLFTGNGKITKETPLNSANDKNNSIITELKNTIVNINKDIDNITAILESKRETIETQKELINNLKEEIKRQNELIELMKNNKQ